MSAQTVKDPLRFARDAAAMAGRYALADLDRLRDELADTEGEVTWRVEGAMVGGRPALRVLIDANPTLICQACLAPYAHPLHGEGVIYLARNDAELERWEHDDPLLDVIVSEEHMDVRTLIEDELLLSLPVVPRHEDEYCVRHDDSLGEH